MEVLFHVTFHLNKFLVIFVLLLLLLFVILYIAFFTLSGLFFLLVLLMYGCTVLLLLTVFPLLCAFIFAWFRKCELPADNHLHFDFAARVLLTLANVTFAPVKERVNCNSVDSVKRANESAYLKVWSTTWEIKRERRGDDSVSRQGLVLTSINKGFRSSLIMKS